MTILKIDIMANRVLILMWGITARLWFVVLRLDRLAA
jgi:hypothetical protein